jgi:hypothetical protein
MENKKISNSYQEIVKAYQGRKKSHVVVRLSNREHQGLTKFAAGRSASAALEKIVSNYLKTMEYPKAVEKSVKKGSFILSADLVEELQKIANDSNTTVSAIIHSALLVAFPLSKD